MRPFLWFVVPCLASLGLGAGSLAAAPIQKAPATLAVTLPADATLTIDGRATNSTSSNRLFVSPPLEPGKDYYYTLKAEFRRAGKTISVRQKVFVRAGRETVVSLNVPAEAVGEYAFAPGAGAGETRSYYYAPGVPVPGTRGTPVVSPFVRTRPAAEEEPPTESRRFPQYGTESDDPFYHGEW